jgi:hypothetical protein
MRKHNPILLLQCLLIHMFSTPTTIFMAILVQPRAKFGNLLEFGLMNGLKPLTGLWTAARL